MAIKSKLITADNFRDFDWNKAKLFYHIAKCGSLLKAAKITGIDQSTLTRHVQTLEKQLGYPLLIRKSGGVVLTRKGEELLEKVAPFFLEVKGFCGNSHVEIKGEKKRKIRIATSHALVSYIISDLILDYNQQNPHLCFELIGDDYLADIILSDVDIVIQPLDPSDEREKIKGVQYECLFSLEKKLYASPAYIDKYGEPQKVEDLINHHIIAFPQPEKDYLYSSINWALTLGVPPGKLHTPTYTSNSIESLIHAAEKGIGIIASFEKYKIIKNSNLKNILPSIKSTPLQDYFIYPDYLKEDETILDIKQYLGEKLSS